MAIVSSYNSFAAILTTDDTTVSAHFFFEDGSISIMAEPDEVTTTANNWRTSRSELNAVDSVEFTLPEDDTASLDVLSIAPGTLVNLWIRKGQVSPARFDKVASCLYQGETKTMQPGRGRRVQLRFLHGTYTNTVAGASALTTYMGSNSLT